MITSFCSFWSMLHVPFPPVMLDSLALDFFMPSLSSLLLTHTVPPPPFLCRQPLLRWITFLGSANWSRMSGIPQTKGSYFLLHKDPHCTQQAQILGGVKEKWRGSLKPYLVSKGEIESHWNLPTGERALSAMLVQCMN